MPVIETKGAASSQGFGEFAKVGGPPVYIEDVMSVFLYTGTGATQTITNEIDLSTKGGLVWMKRRSTAANHQLYDTARGATKKLASNETTAEATETLGLTAFNSTGFTLGSDSNANGNGSTYASWTFRKQPKFFDVVTFTSNANAGATVNHNLGSTPGFVIVKATGVTENWWCWHSALSSTQYLTLNTTSSVQSGSPTISVSSTQVVLSTNWLGSANASYVMYLFASNAGGFGLTGTDNVISCGSWTQTASGATVTLGYEPQWILLKSSSGANNWRIVDNMRGMTVSNSDQVLVPNSSAAETAETGITPTATGFNVSDYFGSSGTFIYIAIRRGPMKTPTSGTSVFSPAYASTNTSPTKVTTGFPVDMQINSFLLGTGTNQPVLTRLQGVSTTTTESGVYLQTAATGAESPSPAYSLGWDNTGFRQFSYYDGAKSGFWNFGRAPGFFDVVCYTGTGSAQNVAHNLNAVPELWIIKDRTSTENWQVGSTLLANTEKLVLNTTAAKVTDTTAWNSTTPTAYVFTVGTQTAVNKGPGGFGPDNYVAYLFATVAGVSKVGSYTGTGALQTINCGFTSGARFVLIKRTDSTGDWYVYDSARGITSGNDPYLLLNSTAAEVTSTNYVDTDTTGFKVTAAAPAGLNASGGTYIFLAIA